MEWKTTGISKTHTDLVFETAQKTLQGLLSGPNFNLLLVNAMQAGDRLTLGSIVVDEAWDMAEALVDKYQEKLSSEATTPKIAETPDAPKSA